MKKLKLTEEQLETMSYSDVAEYVLEQNGKKMKIQDLFMEVIKAMELPESEFEAHIEQFFGLLSTDKRFIMLEKGFWDLKDNHTNKVKLDIEEDEDEEDIGLVEESDEEIMEETDDTEVNYDDESLDDDPEEDDLKDLVVIDTNDEDADMM